MTKKLLSGLRNVYINLTVLVLEYSNRMKCIIFYVIGVWYQSISFALFRRFVTVVLKVMFTLFEIFTEFQ